MNLLHVTTAAARLDLRGAARTGAQATVCAMCLCAALAVQAQAVYRIVGADGRVTFSDKPPVNAEQGKVAATGLGAAAAASAAALPFELRQVVARYPVTLYSAPDCSPCGSARSLLSGRGIPFTICGDKPRHCLGGIHSGSPLAWPAQSLRARPATGRCDDRLQVLDGSGDHRSLVGGHRHAVGVSDRGARADARRLCLRA